MHQAVRLHLNELAYEPPERLVSGSAAALCGIHHYPDRDAGALRAALAEHLGVEPSWVVAGGGSAAVIQQTMVAAGPSEIAVSWPGFEAVESIAAALRMSLRKTPLHNHACDLERLSEAISPETSLAIVCSPHAPTGGVVSHTALEAFLCKVPDRVVVLIDEAYREFAGDDLDALAFVRRYPNVIVTRTFSKAYGLAGLRVGYGIAQPELARRIAGAGLPFQVTAPAEQAALAALHDQVGLRERVARTLAARERMVEALRTAGAPVVVGHGNFVWLPLGEQSTAAAEAFEEQGVLVKPVVPYGLRITVGAEQDTELLAAAWEKHNLASNIY